MINIWFKLSWSKKSALLMASFAHGVVVCMTDNKSFLTPAVLLKILDDAAIRVEKAWDGRKNGQAGKDELKNAINALDILLRTQGSYVATTANNDATIIHSANYASKGDKKNAPKAKASEVLLDAPLAKATAGGTIKVTSNKVLNTRMYVFVLVIGTIFPVTITEGALDIPVGVQVYILNSTKHTAKFVGIPGVGKVSIAGYTVNSGGMSGLSPVTICLNNGVINL